MTAVSTLSGRDQPVVCFLSPVSGSGNIWRRPKSANNAAIQRVTPSLSQEALRYGDTLKNRSSKKAGAWCKGRLRLHMVKDGPYQESRRGMFTGTASPILVQMVRLAAALTKQSWSHEEDTLADAGSVQGTE